MIAGLGIAFGGLVAVAASVDTTRTIDEDGSTVRGVIAAAGFIAVFAGMVMILADGYRLVMAW